MLLQKIRLIALMFLATGSSCKITGKTNTQPKQLPALCNDLDTLTIKGTYLGANLYFANPYVNCIDSSICYTTQKLSINDTIFLTNKQLNASVIEIPLKTTGYKMNTKIKLDFIYIKDNLPRISHPIRE